MTSTTELFDLIKRLSKSEKKYFAMNAQLQKGAKAYMTLFQETDRLAQYDENLLKANLGKLGYNTSNLAVAKVQLAKLILKSLRAFHEGKSPEQAVLSLVSEAEILRKKGLYSQAMKQLDRAKVGALKNEMHYHIFDILNRRAALSLELNEKEKDKKFTRLFEEIELLKSTVQKETELRVIANKLTLLIFSRQHSSRSSIEAFEQYPILESIGNTDSFFAKVNFFFSHALIKHVKGDFTAANPYYLKILELWEKHPYMREINGRLYKVHITNFLNSCHTLGKYDSFDRWLKKFSSIPDTNYDEESGSFKDFYHIKLLYLLNTGQLKKALEIVDEIEDGLERYKQRINKSREMALRFNVFIVFFINEKFSKALDWLGTMALDDKIDERADARTLARIMRVIVHYELGHTRILDYLRNSVYRKLKKEEQLHVFERTILAHIRQLEQVVGRKAQKPLWESLLEKLNELGDTYGRNQIAGLEEIACWAESRLLQKPYANVLAEKKQG